MNQKITPFLWFDGNAEAAANHYAAVFRDAEVVSVNRFGDAEPGAERAVISVVFRIAGQEFVGLNGGPAFAFTEATAFSVSCSSQEEIDELWDKLSQGGETGQCGWLKDRFGLSWIVVPSRLSEMMQDEDRERANRVMQAMMPMTKIDLAALERAYAQG